MLLKIRKCKVFGHFHAQQINNKQILKYLTNFKNSYHLFLKHVGCDITVEYRLLLRTHFVCLAPELS